VKRTKAEFQLPYRLGMSRHGAPVRSTHRMPLTVRRLSFIGGPRSTVGEKWIENAPFPDSRLPPSVKAALESFTYEKTVNTA
jgi:hypothetical protein